MSSTKKPVSAIVMPLLAGPTGEMTVPELSGSTPELLASGVLAAFGSTPESRPAKYGPKMPARDLIMLAHPHPSARSSVGCTCVREQCAPAQVVGQVVDTTYCNHDCIVSGECEREVGHGATK